MTPILGRIDKQEIYTVLGVNGSRFKIIFLIQASELFK